MKRALCVTIAIVCLGNAGTAAAASFPANPGSLGPIADSTAAMCGGPADSRDVTFDVSGLTGTLGNVAVSFALDPAHARVGELTSQLSGPGLLPSPFLFNRPGSTPGNAFGHDSALSGPYTFTDTAPAAPNFPDTAGATSPVSSGSYRPTTYDGAAQPMTPLFSQYLTSLNGVWTLRFNDYCLGNTGTVTSATLTIDTIPLPPAPPASPDDPSKTPKKKCTKKGKKGVSAAPKSKCKRKKKK